MYKAKTSSKMNLHYAGLGMDYMMSLATLAKGYSPDHVIDVVPFVGVTAGLVRRYGKFRSSAGTGCRCAGKAESGFFFVSVCRT